MLMSKSYSLELQTLVIWIAKSGWDFWTVCVYERNICVRHFYWTHFYEAYVAVPTVRIKACHEKKKSLTVYFNLFYCVFIFLHLFILESMVCSLSANSFCHSVSLISKCKCKAAWSIGSYFEQPCHYIQRFRVWKIQR